jgi:hypothetical protein
MIVGKSEQKIIESYNPFRKLLNNFFQTLDFLMNFMIQCIIFCVSGKIKNQMGLRTIEKAVAKTLKEFDSASLIFHGLPWGYHRAESIPSKLEHESIRAKKNESFFAKASKRPLRSFNEAGLRRNGLPNIEKFHLDTPLLAAGSLHPETIYREVIL